MAKGLINMALTGMDQVVKELNAMEKKSEIVLQRTTNDFKARAPAWVSASVSEVYNIKKVDVKSALMKKGVSGKIKISGKTVANAQLVYEGRTLTATHFAMKPRLRPQAKGKRMPPYAVTAEFFKGQRKPLGHHVFLAKGNETMQLPFQRKGKARHPIDVIRSVSVPQMINHERVAESIQAKIAEGLGKRLEHHMQRELQK